MNKYRTKLNFGKQRNILKSNACHLAAMGFSEQTKGKPIGLTSLNTENGLNVDCSRGTTLDKKGSDFFQCNG
jgi:hypothetical protein